ncbi:MAG: SGNH/GDSL hydrolase family protein [Bacteroidales bacterium]|nr:hypothetical protein [Bacteroidales bacterium]MCR5714855.1 SGNH/GDSL hydrolase family protein [Bacteroidales bacterium]
MKQIFKVLLVVLMLCAFGTASAKKSVSILGDSYSAYAKYIPEGNAWWYSEDGPAAANDVKDVEQMWWHIFITRHKYRLEKNNSYSGSTVCYTGYNGRDYTAISFVSRMRDLGKPKIILILGGTNDSWAHAPIGEFKYEGQTQEDLKSFRPAFAYMLNYLKQTYPKAKIINITNSELSDEVTNSMDEISRHYGVKNVLLKDVEKQNGHPSVKGMQAISDQVSAAMK